MRRAPRDPPLLEGKIVNQRACRQTRPAGRGHRRHAADGITLRLGRVCDLHGLPDQVTCPAVAGWAYGLVQQAPAQPLVGRDRGCCMGASTSPRRAGAARPVIPPGVGGRVRPSAWPAAPALMRPAVERKRLTGTAGLAGHLQEVGALRPGLSAERAGQCLWALTAPRNLGRADPAVPAGVWISWKPGWTMRWPTPCSARADQIR